MRPESSNDMGDPLDITCSSGTIDPVIIRVVIEDMRNQRCRRNRALNAKL